ncbi:MAG: glycosyltransferase family 1 protein, partial [Parabacteroides sp.]|nr:glycosyltransferase family 1 protein [Parabacteroides sp.]
REIYKKKFKHACQESDRVIAISEDTKCDLINFFGIDEYKISVVYQGCDPIFIQTVTEKEKQEIKSKYHLPDRYILNIGTIEYRKNLLRIVKAMTAIQDQDIRLVAVGRETPYVKEIETYIQEHGLQHRIQLLHNVAWKDLAAIYQSASIFVYPSLFEGFGIPILEAIHSNVPVIAATGSCLEEAGGPASAYVNPNNTEMLASTIDTILSSPETASRMIKESKAYIARFSDQQIAQDLMNVYKQVL